METSYSVRFIGLYLLTFWKSRGKILSKSVMPPWPAVPYRGVRDFVLILKTVSGCPRCRVVPALGAIPLPSAMQK